LGLIAVAAGLVTTVSVAQAPAGKPTSGALFKAIAKEDYRAAKPIADGLLKSAPSSERPKVMLAYGRILLGQGDREGARKYLAFMAQQQLEHDAQQLMGVYTAWLAFLDGNADATKSLESILQANSKTLAACEAADVLAILYLSQQNETGAKKAVDFGLGVIKYAGLKTDYTETLLKNRLKSKVASSEAESLYIAAEKLRTAGKLVDAGKAFTEIITLHPQTVWAEAANFRIGQCLLGLKRSQQAFGHWKNFLATAPTGPWRGQTHVAIVDLALETNLDLGLASEHAMAATAALAEGVGEKAADSWQEAAFDIHLRHGVVSLVEARFAAAQAALEQARENVPTGAAEFAIGLDRLIAAAESRSPLIPSELAVGDSRTVVALSLGNLYVVLRNYTSAQRFFSLTLTGPARTSSAPHRSFALQGLARTSAAREGDQPNKPFTKAKSFYQQSLKEYPGGAWHEDTLRELALLIERIAAGEATPPEEANRNAARGFGRQVRQPSTHSQEEALAYWTQLATDFPDTRYMPQALFHAGRLCSELNNPVDALTAFSRLVKDHPDSPWTGDGAIFLIDVKLEQQFDLPGAVELAATAVSWYEQLDPADAAQERRGFADDEVHELQTLQKVGYDIYLRRGLIEHLLERHPEALGFFHKAELLQPPRKMVVVEGRIPTGIERLVELAKSGKSLTPELARRGDEQAKLILMMADVFHHGQDHGKSIELFSKLIAGAAPEATREQVSWAFFMRARGLHAQMLPLKAFEDFRRAAESGGSAPWCPTAYFYAANAAFNYEQNVTRGISVWKYIVDTYPDSPEAEKSAYYIGFALQTSGHLAQAQRAYEAFIEKYPDSGYIRPIREHHLPKLAEAQAAVSKAPVQPMRKKGS
jgi:tetratricopeptide (TPR) repeat protein